MSPVMRSVPHHARREIVPPEIAGHHVGPLDQQHAGSSKRQRSKTVRIDDADGDARQRLTDCSSARGRLIVACGAKVRTVDRDHRRTFRHAVALDRFDAEAVLECLGDAKGQLLAPVRATRKELNCSGLQRRA